jgi:hypothetical protein
MSTLQNRIKDLNLVFIKETVPSATAPSVTVKQSMPPGSALPVSQRIAKYEAEAREYGGSSVLHVAAREGDVAALDVLRLSSPYIDLDIETEGDDDDDGLTPLAFAVSYGRLAAVKYLVLENVDINHKTNCGETPLLLAIAAGEYEIAQYLIKQGADIDLYSNTGVNPLISALIYRYHNQLADYLFDRDVVYGVDQEEESPEQKRVYERAEKANFVEYLLEEGADMFANGGNIRTFSFYDFVEKEAAVLPAEVFELVERYKNKQCR